MQKEHVWTQIDSIEGRTNVFLLQIKKNVHSSSDTIHRQSKSSFNLRPIDLSFNLNPFFFSFTDDLSSAKYEYI